MPKLRPRDLITNDNGHISTTGFIQFAGFVVLAGVLLWSVWLDRATTGELYAWFATYCGGLTVTKGAVTAYKETRTNTAQRIAREQDV